MKNLQLVRRCNQSLSGFSQVLSRQTKRLYLLVQQQIDVLESLSIRIFTHEEQFNCVHNTHHVEGKIRTYNTKIKEFEGNFVIYNDDTLKFIMEPLPNSNNTLKSMYINAAYWSPDMELKRCDISAEWMIMFFEYISRVPDFDVNNVYLGRCKDKLSDRVSGNNKIPPTIL